MSKTKHAPSFAVSKFEHTLISAIADRAVALAKQHGFEYDKRTALMDITACHANGCPLKLDELRDADDGTFGHDVFGIRRCIDRRTGALTECFLPRTALT